MKFLVRKPELYEEPKSNQPPPWWIRGTADLHLHRRVVLRMAAMTARRAWA